MVKQPPVPRTDKEAYQLLLSFHGLTKMQIAKHLGISKQAITRWDTVPLKYVTPLSQATGIPREYLRPSDYT